MVAVLFIIAAIIGVIVLIAVISASTQTSQPKRAASSKNAKRSSLPARRPPSSSVQTSRLRSRPNVVASTETDDDSDALAGLLLLAGVAWLGSKVITAGFEFLKDVDWDEVGVNLRKAIEQAEIEVERYPDVASRLDRAEQLILSGGEVNLDEAAMLTSATLELGLRQLATRRRISIDQDNNTLAGLAIELGQAGYLTHGDQRQIQYYAASVRNRVMHGEFGVISAADVSGFHALARRCLAANGIA